MEQIIPPHQGYNRLSVPSNQGEYVAPAGKFSNELYNERYNCAHYRMYSVR